MIYLKQSPQNRHTTSEVKYSDNGKVLYSDNELIMMDFEYPFMAAGARTVAQNGGDVLNVGFGMGIIDSEIQKYKPKSHNIIEIHPAIQKNILKNNWDLKPNVNLYFGDWRDFIEELPKMDGIYFDTLDTAEFIDFIGIAWKLLKPGGVFSYFNNPSWTGDDDSLLITPEYHKIAENFYNIEIETIPIKEVDIDLQKQYSNYGGYWNPNKRKYYNLILKPKQYYDQ